LDKLAAASGADASVLEAGLELLAVNTLKMKQNEQNIWN
jgi:hypothetical protein